MKVNDILNDSEFDSYDAKVDAIVDLARNMELELERLRAELATMKALLREAAKTAEYAAYQLEKARIWGGIDWHYNPLHPLHYRSALERLRDILPRIRDALGEKL